MVNLTIDGKKITVPAGTTVLKAAESAEIEIPTLCDHPQLTPYGGCRMCVVEIEGSRTLQTSCTLPVMENMVVHTNTEKVREARKFILTMIFSDRNHFCPYCVVNDGDCELQQAAYAEDMTHWPIQPNWKPYEVDASHPYIVQDHNRCILCRRCVRACAELVGNFTLGVEERGANSLIMADLGTPLGESSCVSCGVCVQVCPTGSLIDRWSAYRGQKEDLQAEQTICIGCSLGCGVTTMSRDNYLVKIDGDWDAEPNHGVLCKVGHFMPLDDQNERVAAPMMRKDGKLTSVSWEEAIKAVAKEVKPVATGKQNGAACLVSTRLSLESLHLSKEIFATSLHSDMVTSLEEGKLTSLSNVIAEKIGAPYQNKLEDIEQADTLVLIGADLVNDHEVASFLIKRHVACGANLVILDDEENPLDYISTQSLHFSSKSSVVDALEGLSAAIIKEGLNKTNSSINANRTLEHAAALTEISTAEFTSAAQVIGKSEKTLIIFGDNQNTTNETLLAEKLIDFAKISGAAQKGWGGMLSMKGKANSLAAAQYGLDKPIILDGKQFVYIALGDEQPSQRFVQQMENIPFLVVQAAYTSKLTAMADIVLPTVVWGKESGHYMNINGKINTANKFREAGQAVKSNHEILSLLAEQLKIDDRCGQDWETPLKDRMPVSVPEI